MTFFEKAPASLKERTQHIHDFLWASTRYDKSYNGEGRRTTSKSTHNPYCQLEIRFSFNQVGRQTVWRNAENGKQI